jgi:dihydrolipoamide dehydrogenase
MTKQIEVKTPDLGDFENVPIIEIFVKVGDLIAKDDLLLAIESDKATMEIPASESGQITEILVKVGDTVSSGMTLVKLESDPSTDHQSEPDSQDQSSDKMITSSHDDADKNTGTYDISAETANHQGSVQTQSDVSRGDMHCQLVILGAGPGGYTAAFRAADLGMDVILIERYASLGGVCLNVGCIPSKALLHVARVKSEAEESETVGLHFAPPKVDINQTLKWKNGVVHKLTQGLASLAKKRKVHVIHGTGRFTSPNMVEIKTESGSQTVSFEQAVIAAGSQPVEIPSFPHDDERVINSTDALALKDIPKRLLIVGGGIIGLEMATVYHALGSKVTIVEMLDHLIAGADPDLVRPLMKRIKSQYENIWLKTEVTSMKPVKTGIKVSFKGDKAPDNETFDMVLVSVGRRPNGNKIGAELAGINVTDQGFIDVDDQQRTNISHIFAIGDVVGQPMLAHKAVHEGKVAAEVASGMKSGFDARVIPNVAYTDPEVAWVGITETEAKEKGIDYGKGVFPWAASGRALSQARSEGVTKLIFDKSTDRLIGAGITGANAGDLIAETVLGIELNADAQDIGLSIHAHPTLAETIGFAAEVFEGTITDLYIPKRK